MIIVVKELRRKVRESNKQISLEAIQILGRHIDKVISEIIAKNTQKRITDENIQL